MFRYKTSVVVFGGLFLVFLIKDVKLFHTIQSMRFDVNTSSAVPNISAKTVMLDQLNSYVMAPLSHAFESTIRLSQRFPGLTANHVSLAGVVVALLASRVVLSDALPVRRLAVVLFLLRQFLDDLDGLIARIRSGLDRHLEISVTGTSGYAMDGICDAIAFSVFLVAVFVQTLRQTNALSTANAKYKRLESGESSSQSSCETSPGRQLFRNHLLFGLQMALACVLWNRYIDCYHLLLETHPTAATVSVFKSRLQFVIMWLWRCYGNAHQQMTIFLASVWLSRSQQLVQSLHFIGFVALLSLAFLSEMHLKDIETYLKHISIINK
ncbi:ceramide phosphoethanolamine synthase-like [Oppia nitens]|uniref:ceramide phosphoethanolamine synthase-like n=1 Tax=Oppia nitens TaxID=1686743 RepID=UPI0023DC10F0|nr:ceramide phosphoethanolamine synthase-like [Oppia nitens]